MNGCTCDDCRPDLAGQCWDAPAGALRCLPRSAPLMAHAITHGSASINTHCRPAMAGCPVALHVRSHGLWSRVVAIRAAMRRQSRDAWALRARDGAIPPRHGADRAADLILYGLPRVRMVRA